MLREDEEEFDHQVTALTVRDLARALGVPDDVPLSMPDDRRVICATAEEPGGDTTAEDQVVIVIDQNAEWVNYYDRDSKPEPVFYLGLEFPSGRYVRRKR